MTCKKKLSDEIYDDYLFGRLSEQDVEKYEEHFFFCKKCTEILSHRRLIIEALSGKNKDLLKLGKSNFVQKNKTRPGKKKINQKKYKKKLKKNENDIVREKIKRLREEALEKK